MPTKIIAASVEVTDKASAPMKDVTKAATDTNKALKETSTATKEVSSNFSNLHEQIAQLPGGLGDAGDGVSKLNTAFKALLANPVVLVITAIVGALAFLYKSFTNTREGGEKMEQAFAGIKAAADVVLDRIFELGGAIIKFFSGDFKGAFEDAKKAVTGIADAIENAYTKTAEFTKQLQKIHLEQSNADVAAAKREHDLAALREKALDPDVPVAKRKELIKQLKDLDDKAAADDIDRAKRRRDANIGLLTLDAEQAGKNKEKINEQNIEFEKTQTAADNERRKADRLLKQANKEEAAKAKQEADAAKAEAKKQQAQDEAFAAQLRKLHQETTLAGITDQYTKETQLLENKIEDENALIKKQFQDGKITQAQYDELQIAQAESDAVRRLALIDKHNKELAAAEQKHQDEVDKIIEDARKKRDADELAAEKKKLQDAKKHTTTVLNDPKSAYKARQAAIDAEQKQFQTAFDNKHITESEYNDEVEQLAVARTKIKDEELMQLLKYGDAASTTFDNLAEIAGKQTAAGKAFSVAAATISAISGAVKSYESMAAIPIVGPALGFVAAAAALVAGYANVQKILAVQVPGQSSGGASLPTLSTPAAPVAPSQSSTKIDQGSINEFGNAMNQKQMAFKTYVVEQDSAAAANRAARLQSASILGGSQN